jgi:hypothetical protein
MRAVKKLCYLVFVIGVLTVFAAPLGYTFVKGSPQLDYHVSYARLVPVPGGSASPAPSSDNFLPSPGCVKIAVPLVNNGGTCVSNSASSGGAIVNYLRGWLELLGGVVGLLVMLMIVVAGVQYITSTGDPGLVKSAKQRLFNAILALVLYLMMFAILQFLIPGGIL